MTNSTNKFKVGDLAFEVGYGIVKIIDVYDNTVQCDDHGLQFGRLADGRKNSESPVPSLYTIEEARKIWPDAKCLQKKKVKKQLTGYLALFSDKTAAIELTEESAIELTTGFKTAAPIQKVTIDYEVEEEEPVPEIKPKKIKKEVSSWMVIDNEGFQFIFPNKFEASMAAVEGERIVKLTGEYETEE